LKNQKNTKP